MNNNYADISYITNKWIDIPYATTSLAQKLDIYLPEDGDGPFPVILSIHGGAFMMGDKRDTQINPHLKALKKGYAVVGINYRLSGEAIFPAGLQDIKAAIRWVRANATTYHLNSDRMATWGGSAGGNYSAMICTTANRKELEDLSLGNESYPCHIHAAVDWFGPTDFLKMDLQFAVTGNGVCDHNDLDSPESKYLGSKITDIPQLVPLANPMTYIHQDMPPIMIMHGSLDQVVPTQQSIIFAEMIEEKVGKERVCFEILEGAYHGGPEFDCDENVEKVIAFLDRYLK